MTVSTKAGRTCEFSHLLAERWFEVQGLPFHVVVATPDQKLTQPELNPVPVVLVHGLGVSSRYMLPTAQKLAPYFQVFAPDLPGFGKSGKPAQVLNISQLADVLAEFLEVAGLEQVSLVANSMGCQVVVDLAVRYPALVTKLVLTGPTIDPRHRTAMVEIGRLLRDTPGESLNQIHLALADYLRCGPRRLWQTFQYALEDHIEAKAPKVGVPVLVVRGSRDPIAPQQWVEELANLFPAGQLAVIEDAPHAVTNKAAARLVKCVLPFLAENKERNA